jgi:hypothetical protein
MKGEPECRYCGAHADAICCGLYLCGACEEQHGREDHPERSEEEAEG